MGAIAFGQRLLGKVDRVPGKYHVATLFWHFCYLPLIPLGTFIVLSEQMQGMNTTFRGVRIPFSAKSYVVAWVRTAVIGLFIISWIATVTLFAVAVSGTKEINERNALVESGSASGITTFLLVVPYWIPGVGRATRATAARLEELIQKSEPVSRDTFT